MRIIEAEVQNRQDSIVLKWLHEFGITPPDKEKSFFLTIELIQDIGIIDYMDAIEKKLKRDANMFALIGINKAGLVLQFAHMEYKQRVVITHRMVAAMYVYNQSLVDVVNKQAEMAADQQQILEEDLEMAEERN